MNWRGRTLLAPLTKGGNLPFRRLCVDFGAEITMSEMAYAWNVVKRRKSELALLRKHDSEACFGVQFAVGKPKDGVAAGLMAVDRGAAFVDLNCGCPIHDTVRRGMGATLMRRPDALVKIVAAMVEALPVPVTVKIRSGWNEASINAGELAEKVEAAGAAALTIHPRTRDQRYSKAADWSLIAEVAAERTIPVIGNGDILTWYEAEQRREESDCASVMLARGALIKPWLFREVAERKTWLPTVEERIEVAFRLATYMKEHFRDDDIGRERAMRFLPWHLGFLCRYRAIDDERGRALAAEHPLMQTRLPDSVPPEPLDQLLADPREEVHAQLAAVLWDSADVDAAVERCGELATTLEPVAGDAGEVATAHG